MENEKRLIDANELMKVVKQEHDLTMQSEYVSKQGKYYENGCFLRVLRFIDKAPTVDTVEVVHGRWIFKHNPITDPKGYFIRIVCSECNLHTGQKSNYCPNCGAKMDGGN